MDSDNTITMFHAGRFSTEAAPPWLLAIRERRCKGMDWNKATLAVLGYATAQVTIGDDMFPIGEMRAYATPGGGRYVELGEGETSFAGIWVTEINAPREHVGLGWRQDDDGTWIVARITDEGLRAIGIDPNEGDAPEEDEQSAAAIARRNAERRAATVAAAPVADTAPAGADDAAEGDAPADEAEPAQGAPTPAPRASLRDTAAAVLAAWDASPAQDATDNPISRAIEALRTALAGKPPRAAREPGAPRKPREGTKQERVLAMLRRPEGATVAQIADATGWAQHTVRGFFAGLKKKGHAVEVRERIRQVGPNKTGAKGSFTVYALCGAPHKA